MEKFVYDFSEGTKDMKELLGGKGANLASMKNLGLPVPDGFIITTKACNKYAIMTVEIRVCYFAVYGNHFYITNRPCILSCSPSRN